MADLEKKKQNLSEEWRLIAAVSEAVQQESKLQRISKEELKESIDAVVSFGNRNGTAMLESTLRTFVVPPGEVSAFRLKDYLKLHKVAQQ